MCFCVYRALEELIRLPIKKRKEEKKEWRETFTEYWKKRWNAEKCIRFWLKWMRGTLERVMFISYWLTIIIITIIDVWLLHFLFHLIFLSASLWSDRRHQSYGCASFLFKLCQKNRRIEMLRCRMRVKFSRRWISPHVINLVKAGRSKARMREKNHHAIHIKELCFLFFRLRECKWTARRRASERTQEPARTKPVTLMARTSNTHVDKTIYRSVNVFRRFLSRSPALALVLAVVENSMDQER